MARLVMSFSISHTASMYSPASMATNQVISAANPMGFPNPGRRGPARRSRTASYAAAGRGSAESGPRTSAWPDLTYRLTVAAADVRVRGSQVAQESVRDRPGAVGPGAAALDQHREGQVAAIADEPAVRRRVRAGSVLGRPGLAVDPGREADPGRGAAGNHRPHHRPQRQQDRGT